MYDNFSCKNELFPNLSYFPLKWSHMVFYHIFFMNRPKVLLLYYFLEFICVHPRNLLVILAIEMMSSVLLNTSEVIFLEEKLTNVSFCSVEKRKSKQRSSRCSYFWILFYGKLISAGSNNLFYFIFFQLIYNWGTFNFIKSPDISKEKYLYNLSVVFIF